MIAADHRPTTMLGVLRSKLIGLGRDEDGAALVITLAIFFLMYLGCMGVYAISMAVKERIHLQNAADAAAYSAAVVQADTLSRIATINRAMSWTYVQMTRRQMDYIVHRWLAHTCEHYESDSLGGSDEKGKKHDGLSDYNKHSIFMKGPCAMHKSFGVGWHISADGSPLTSLMVHLNGHPGGYTMPRGGGNVRLPSVSSGHLELEAALRAKLLYAEEEYIRKYGISDTISQMPRLATDLAEITTLTYQILSGYDVSLQTSAVLADNLREAGKTLVNWDASGRNAYVDITVPLAMKVQIAIDKLDIARMNVCERHLALAMPGRIATCVEDVLKANVAGVSMCGAQMDYILNQCRPLCDELTGSASLNALLGDDRGYLVDLSNTTDDEERFMRFSGYCNGIYNTFDKGINQWFVRGNGSHRTEGEYGIQRCFKHMTKDWINYDRNNADRNNAAEPLSNVHATHNPLEPTCWNTKMLENAEQSCALFSEWQWWSDTWTCFTVPTPAGVITVHVNAPHRSELWPSRASCPHHSKPGLLGLKSGSLSTPSLADLISGAGGAAKSALLKKPSRRHPWWRLRAKDYYYRSTFGLNFIVSLDNFLGNYEPIEEFHDGCPAYPDILEKIPRQSIFKFVGYARLYADDPHLYTNTYMGMKALPLVVNGSYFGKSGTISVGVRRKNENVFMRILGRIEGIFKAFDPDWNDEGADTYTYVFASAKAGYKDKGESVESLQYKVDWQPGNQEWNLCQSDWDAVFVPVSRAYSGASVGFWIEGGDQMLDDWVIGESDKWQPLAGGGTDNARCENTYAPRGVLRGNGHDGTLKWRELSHVMFH